MPNKRTAPVEDELPDAKGTRVLSTEEKKYFDANIDLIDKRLNAEGAPPMSDEDIRFFIDDQHREFSDAMKTRYLSSDPQMLGRIVHYIHTSRIIRLNLEKMVEPSFNPSVFKKNLAEAVTTQLQTSLKTSLKTSLPSILHEFSPDPHDDTSSGKTITPMSVASTIIGDQMQVSYNEDADQFETFETSDSSLREASQASQVSMPMEAVEESEIGINVFNILAANLMALSIGIEPDQIGSPAPLPQSRARSVATDMSIESSSIAASIMEVLKYENSNPNLTLAQVNAQVDYLVLELRKREELRAIVVPQRGVIPQHYVFAVGISTRDGSVTPATPAVKQAMVSPIPLLEKTEPVLFELLDALEQQRAEVMCGPRVAPAGVCLSLSAQVKKGMYMSQIVSAIQNVPDVMPIDPKNPPNPCTLTFIGNPIENPSFGAPYETELRTLFIQELQPVVEVLKTIGMTGYMPILINRVEGIGHFIRIILFPSGEYEGTNYNVDELKYGVMFVDPANSEGKQTLDEFIKNPIKEELNSISAFRWATSFPNDITCGEILKYPTPTDVGIQIDLYTPGETAGGGSPSKKRSMKKHKKPKGSGNRSKNKRNKSASHMKKRVKHLLKAAKKRGQSGKHSKSSKNAKRKSRTKKDNTIKRLKIKGLGRTRKLNKHGRK